MNRQWERVRIGSAVGLGLASSVLVLVFTAQQVDSPPTGAGSDRHPIATQTAEPPATPTATPTGSPTPTASLSPTAVTSVTATPDASEPPATAAPGSAAELAQLLAQVTVVPQRPNVDGYDRSCSPGAGCVFGPAWTDDTRAPLGHNGCDTRNDVLRHDLTDITVDPGTNGCVVRTGTLADPYTGRSIAFQRGWETSRAIEIDHLIPLAAAWDMGAWRWTPAQRAAFANDVEHELLAVDGPANQQKSDSTPASWLPPNKAFRCTYASRYLRASMAWDLPITAADAEVLRAVARRCP